MEFKENMTLERLPDAMVYLLGEIADIKTILRNRAERQIEQKEDQRLNGDKALAKYLKCSVQTVAVLKKDGKVSFHRMGRRCYYLTSEVDRDLLVESRRFGRK
jgi:hypothetical protein